MQEPRNPQRTKLIRKHADVSSPFSKGYINRTVKYNERPRSVWINTEEGKKVTAEESTRLPVYNNGVGLLKTWKSPTAVSPHHNINDFSRLAGNSKALEKLKETINFQRLNRSSVELESSKSCNASDIKEVAGDQDVGRKIAVVSYAPSYKGFNEATTKVRKITENNHHQTFHPSTLTKDGQEPYSAKTTDVSMRTFSRKFIKTAGGKVGGDFPITTSAWKKGKIIAENILQNSSHKNANQENKLPHNASKEKKIKHKLENTNAKPLNNSNVKLSAQTQSILHDIQLSPAQERKPIAKRKPKVPGTNISTSNKGKYKAARESGRTSYVIGEKPDKIRHYDRDQVKHFMAGQRLARKKERIDSTRKAQEAIKRKQEQLKHLESKRREGRHKQKSIEKKETCEVGQSITFDSTTFYRSPFKEREPSAPSDNNITMEQRSRPEFLQKLDLYLNEEDANDMDIRLDDDMRLMGADFGLKVEEVGLRSEEVGLQGEEVGLRGQEVQLQGEEIGKRSEDISIGLNTSSFQKQKVSINMDRISALKLQSESLQKKIRMQSEKILQNRPNFAYKEELVEAPQEIRSPPDENRCIADDQLGSEHVGDSASFVVSEMQSQHLTPESRLSGVEVLADNLVHVDFCGSSHTVFKDDERLDLLETRKKGLKSGDKHSVANLFSRKFIHYSNPKNDKEMASLASLPNSEHRHSISHDLTIPDPTTRDLNRPVSTLSDANVARVSQDPMLRDLELHDPISLGPMIRKPELHDSISHDSSLHDVIPHDSSLHDVIPHDSPLHYPTSHEGIIITDDSREDSTSATSSAPYCRDREFFPQVGSSLRYSPDTLERQICLELNRYDTADEALNQIVNTECVRSIAAAQQETVSIGQVLQTRQMEHNRELERLAEAAKQLATVETKKNNNGHGRLFEMHSSEDQSHSYSQFKENSIDPDSLSTVSYSPHKSSSSHQLSSKNISKDISIAPEKSNVSDISEEISIADSHKDDTSNALSVQFDESLTEDEIAELSRRAIVPSESQRRSQRKHPSLQANKPTYTDPSSDETCQHASESHTSVSSLFGESEHGSFDQFMSSTVQQYMLEQEVRARHRSAMLKLREKAIKEKTQAELAWLEQRKNSFRNKGADDKMPPIKKKKRAILQRLKAETEGLKKLRAANRAANQDFELIRLQQKDITRIVQTTNQIKHRIKSSMKDSPESTEQHSIIDPAQEEPLSNLDKSTEYSGDVGRGSRRILDDRKLTAREKVLLKRRREAERLIEWKKKLDAEEIKVESMEKLAISVWNGVQHETTGSEVVLEEDTTISTNKNASEKEKLQDKKSSDLIRSLATNASLSQKDLLESLSDESFSQTQSETEQSDIECRVYALKDELKKCRLVADRLKKQQKRKHKEQMRAQEESLRNQIKAYNNYIKKAQTELEQEIDHASSNNSHQIHASSLAKPQIRSPRKNEQYRKSPRGLRSVVSVASPEASPRAGSQLMSRAKSRSDSESSSRSSRSLSYDDQHAFMDDSKPETVTNMVETVHKDDFSGRHDDSDDITPQISSPPPHDNQITKSIVHPIVHITDAEQDKQSKVAIDGIVEIVWGEILEESLDVLLTTSSPHKKEKDDIGNDLVDNIMNGLLDDTITHVLKLHKQHAEPMVNGRVIGSDLEEEHDVEIVNKPESESLARPVSPIFGTNQEEIAEEWFDDDFGISSKISNNKNSEKELDELIVANPILQSLDHIMELVHESMTKIADGHGHDFHLPHSNDHHAVFNQSVTDLVAYMGNETQDVKGQGKKWTKITSFKKEHVMDICDEVGKIFFADKQANHRNRLKWGTLKKRDMVDLILINELRCDEHNWTDYDNDEHTVKEQLCHVMFELLIHDTLTSFKQINNLKTGVHSE